MAARDRIQSLLAAMAGGALTGARISYICGIGSWRLYSALASLEKDGLIESFWEEHAQAGAARRRFYRIKISSSHP